MRMINTLYNHFVQATMTLLQSVFVFALCSLLQTAWSQENDTCVNNYRIIGGHTVSIEDVPFIVSLFENGDLACGGSIIHERFILTAAHCISWDSNTTYQVLVGSDRLNTGGVFIDVELTLCHEGFDPIANDNMDDDICLLKLNESVPFGCKVAKADLPDKDFEIKDGLMVNVTGWGNTQTHGVHYPNDLRQTMVPLVSDECCRSLYPNVTNDKMFCAGSRGHDSCQGDSGGPLTYNNVQIGIVSFGYGCADIAGVYTKVSEFLTWINNTIEENL